MPELSPGAVLGERFEIAGVLGRGGMATVYLARDRVRDERVALKVLHGHLAAQPSARERLRREIAAAGRIRHPRALVAHELFELDGALALSMPLHPGVTLAEDLATRGALDVERLWALGECLSAALAEAHRAGVVHRDVAPGNVMMDAARQGTLTDFGLARLEDAHSRTATTAVGTAGYTAPELLDGQRAGPAADLYGLGCVLYLAATGRAPFEAPTPLAILSRQAEGRFVPVRELRPEVPEALARTIEALLARAPEARPESARAVSEALARREAVGASGAPHVAPHVEVRAAEAPAAGPPLAPPRLEGGRYAVVVRERHDQRERRRRRRQRARRARRAGFEAVVEGAAELIERKVRDAMGLPEGREPELLLAEAVAEEAGLPADALRVAPALSEPEFRLVDGVSAEVAGRLAERVGELGFDLDVVDRGVSGRVVSGVLIALGGLLRLAIIGGVIAALPILQSQILVWTAINAAVLAKVLTVAPIVGGVMALGVLISTLGRVLTGPRLPEALAYRADLRTALNPEYARRVEATAPPPTRVASPTAAAPAPAPAAPAPAASPPPPDPLAALMRLTGERLAGLGAAIDASAHRLPSPAVLDLQTTLGELRERARAIELDLRRLAEHGRGQDARAAEDAAAAVSARLERLEARARAGDPVEAAELDHLRRALRGHQDQLAAIELDEQRATRLQAALLEIGAAAERCRRTLLHEADPARSVDDLLGRLRAESAAAAAAVDEAGDEDGGRRDAARRRAASAARG